MTEAQQQLDQDNLDIAMTTAVCSGKTLTQTHTGYRHEGKIIYLTNIKYLEDFVCNGIELQRA